MNIGDNVRVSELFRSAYPDVYVIRDIQGTTAFLDGVPEGFADAFDFMHLEVV